MRLLAHSNENINELVGKYYDASQFIDYKADIEQPLPMIYQSGYLTIKECNLEDNTYLLDFPNEEVRNGFIDTIASRYFANTSQTTSWVMDVTNSLRKGDTSRFEKLMTALLSSVTYRFQRKQDPMECERYFQYTFYLYLKPPTSPLPDLTTAPSSTIFLIILSRRPFTKEPLLCAPEL